VCVCGCDRGNRERRGEREKKVDKGVRRWGGRREGKEESLKRMVKARRKKTEEEGQHSTAHYSTESTYVPSSGRYVACM
jgi:hypothetical protein